MATKKKQEQGELPNPVYRDNSARFRAKNGAIRLIESLMLKGYDTDEDKANFEETAVRVAKAYDELVLPKHTIKERLEDIMSKSFPMEGDAGIIIQDCITSSLCPHHLLPVIHQMYVGYLPKKGGQVLGISKLIRVADILSRRAILQEKLAIDITAALYNGYYDDDMKQPTEFPFIESEGSICVMASLHCCQSCRGVRSFSLAREVSLRGAFLKNTHVKEEAFSIIQQFPSKQFPIH